MDGALETLLAYDDAELSARWTTLQQRLAQQFGRDAGLEAILFLIGVQERGQGYEPRLGKAVKQDLIMEGTYCAFERLGFYERVGAEPDGQTVWARRAAPLPTLDVDQQEKLLRLAVLRYFDHVYDQSTHDEY